MGRNQRHQPRQRRMPPGVWKGRKQAQTMVFEICSACGWVIWYFWIMDSTKFNTVIMSKIFHKCPYIFHKNIMYFSIFHIKISQGPSPFFPSKNLLTKWAPAPVSRSHSATFQKPLMSTPPLNFHPLLHHRLDVKRHRNRCSAISPSNAYLGVWLKNVDIIFYCSDCSDDFVGGVGLDMLTPPIQLNIWGLGTVRPHHPFIFQYKTTTKSWYGYRSRKVAVWLTRIHLERRLSHHQNVSLFSCIYSSYQLNLVLSIDWATFM